MSSLSGKRRRHHVGASNGGRRRRNLCLWVGLRLSISQVVSSIQRILWLLLLTVCGPAAAEPPLILAADIGDHGMHIWWRPGELLVGDPSSEARPGLRPLISDAPLILPEDLSEWTPVGETCQESPRAEASLEGQPVVVSIHTDPTRQLMVRLIAGNRLIAENTLGRPVQVCEIRIDEADPLPGAEVIIAWRFGEGESQIRGLTVFRVPRTARY